MADRGDVGLVRLCLAIAILLVGSLVATLGAPVDQPCEVVPMPCTFEALPFKFTVVDTETQQPLADVHALAEWQTEGVGGRANGPLMVKDTVSGADGLISIEAWGPIEGPWTGLVIGSDPVVTLFKTGYKAKELHNGYLPPGQERERVRRFVRKDTKHALEPFRGTAEQWLEELQKISNPKAAPISDELLLRFREPYLRRFHRLQSELERLPEPLRSAGRRRMLLDRDLRLLEKGQR